MSKLHFASDYQEGAHPAILNRLADTNYDGYPGYGTDPVCGSARERIREACACPGAGVHFLVGGTQTNAAVIGALLKRWQGVIAPDTGHIASHEAGAIEHGGHKVLPLPQTLGKIRADQIRDYCRLLFEDGNRDHMVMPGMVCLAHPTEYGTLYSLEEMTAISRVCREYGLPLYVDGARLAYALACPANDLTLADLARLCDAFYIGGTKCGALFGEALVVPDPSLLPHFFTLIKQEGALLAKGWLLGIQFDELFRDGLYERIGRGAIEAADILRKGFADLGAELAFDSPTNQVFVRMRNEDLKALEEVTEYSFWEKSGEDHTIIRLASSWATRPEDAGTLIRALSS